jgi:hypothetical protein
VYRCFEAILKLEKDYVYWPNQEERNQIKRHFGSRSFFKDCVGCIDGTLIPLAFAPGKNPEDFWTRKHMYALNSLLVSDHQGRIIYAKHGWCGSAHDQRVYNSTHVSHHFESDWTWELILLTYAACKKSRSIFWRRRIPFGRLWLYMFQQHHPYVQKPAITELRFVEKRFQSGFK